jgi:hypothetical protein
MTTKFLGTELDTPAVGAALTGTAGRYVGNTSGAPSSGTYVTGDFAFDPTNKIVWICTAGGTPGTWTVLTKTMRICHNYSVAGPLAVPSGATNFLPGFFMPIPTGQSAELAGVYAVVRGTTSATMSINQNGSAVSSLSALTVTTTAGFTACGTPPTVANGDAFAPVISSISGTPDGLSLSFFFDVTV